MPTEFAHLTDAYRNRFPRSAELYLRGATVFPDGVTHDGRALAPFPPYVTAAAGACKTTVDGVELIDYWMGHGSLLLGHSHPELVNAVGEQVQRGTHFGASHELEIRWAEQICALIPSAERVRFTNSGTEATLMALRLCRLISGRTKVIKLAGAFHGWHDQLAPGADPPHSDSRYPTPGIPDEVLDQLIVVRPNDLAAVEQAISRHRPACVILEGTGGRWGVVPFRMEFVRGVRELTAATGTLLIVDEVITGFRVAPGGAQEHYGIIPDFSTLAKVVAGGLPGGCLAGKAEFMEALASNNRYGQKMKHPGTYNGNPLSAVAGLTMLKHVATGIPCREANAAGAKLRADLNALFQEQQVNWIAYGDFSLTHILPHYSGNRAGDSIPFDGDFERLDQPIEREFVNAFRCATLLAGVDCMGLGLITSSMHTPAVIDQTVAGFRRAIETLRASGYVDSH